MGDVRDASEVQITPETPGRPAILNPFESPNDYHRLHESVVASPSLFKRSRCSSAATISLETPAKFKWSIDEMASLLPVEIDPEDIQRQSLYLSQTRADKEIEEKRQHAIDQFFTKNAIVPSPWAALGSKQSTQMQTEFNSISPGICEDNHLQGKSNGDYYRMDEVSEQVQENLSSSSLRRKLFLDGNGSGSELSAPSSPERSPVEGPLGSSGTADSAASPLQCGTAVLTPTSGQFSSSPIQGRGRAYSLGSVPSPMFPEKSSPTFKSPMLSPIVLQYMKTPLSGERKKLIFQTPEGIALSSSNMDMSCCRGSPFVEGCSPIKSCSPVQHKGCGWVAPHHRTSPPHLSPPIFEDKENVCPTDDGLPAAESESLPVPLAVLSESCEDALHNVGSLCENKTAVPGFVPTHDTRDNKTVNMEEVIENREEYSNGAEGTPFRLTSSRTGSMLNVENSHMSVSILAEGSTMPYDNSMQVDSGYNTYSAPTNSTMEGLCSESHTKELLDGHVLEEVFSHTKNQHVKAKIFNLHH